MTRLAAGLLALAVLHLPAAVHAATGTWHVDLTFAGGYDDDVLARAGDNASFPVIAEDFYQAAPSLAATLSFGRWALLGGADYLLNAYGSDEAGLYHDAGARLGASVALTPALDARLVGETGWFRRSEFADYDFDRRELRPSLLLRLDDRWSLEGSARFGRVAYLERQSLAAGEEQVDEPVEWDLNAAFAGDTGKRAWGGVTRLLTDSNARFYEYDGYRLYAGGELPVGRGWSVEAEARRETRRYDGFRFRQFSGRSDDSWEFRLDAARALPGSARLFGGVSWLDYGSELGAYAFDQFRVRAGVSIRLPGSGAHFGGGGGWGWESALVDGANGGGGSGGGFGGQAASPLAPRLEEAGILFRWKAAGATRVALAGSFNGWSLDAAPMADPDGDGTWEVRIRLEPGLHRYMFVENGTEWRTPEGAPLYEEDGFGQKNGVLSVTDPVTGAPETSPSGRSQP